MTPTTHMRELRERENAPALKDKVAVVTGGSTGIGFATARRFLEAGARVVVTGRTQDTLDGALAELGAPGGVLGVRGDVARLADLDRLYATVKERFGRLDVVFANAGIAQFAPCRISTKRTSTRSSTST